MGKDSWTLIRNWKSEGNLHQSSVIDVTINWTQHLLPAHQFNIIRCLTMRTIYILKMLSIINGNQQCSDEQLFSFFITYRVMFSERTLHYRKLHSLRIRKYLWNSLNCIPNANANFKALKLQKCFEEKFKLLKRFSKLYKSKLCSLMPEEQIRISPQTMID